MPMKQGAGGRQQNYDSHTGKYCKTNYFNAENTKMSKREKSRIKRANQINMFCIQADKKGDILVKDVFLAIENEIPNSIQLVNSNKYDDINKKVREFDIMTKKVVIEVKKGKARRCLTQFQEQNNYAQNKGKKFVVFAPHIADGTKKEYNKNGIEIKTKIKDLINFIKEYEKWEI